MKKSGLLFARLPFSKMGILPFLLTLLFFAGMQIDMKAQNHLTYQSPNVATTKTLDVIPTGPFVAAHTAIERLDNARVNLKNQLRLHPEGTTTYNQLYRRYLYYNQIKNEIVNSERTVGEGITYGLVVIRTTTSVYAANAQELANEKTLAINLLKV